jgi:hypothetical protein
LHPLSVSNRCTRPAASLVAQFEPPIFIPPLG